MQATAEAAAGRLSAAAEALEAAAAGSAAGPAAAEWAQHAQARASADQTLALLRAHATALTSALS
jgi:hypothetical protein